MREVLDGLFASAVDVEEDEEVWDGVRWRLRLVDMLSGDRRDHNIRLFI